MEPCVFSIGLNSGGFVNWVLNTAGCHLGYTHSIDKIWDQTAPLGTRNTVREGDLLPGDLGFINSHDDRVNDAEGAHQTEEELNPWNTVGIYLGTNELGERIWIQCSKSNACVAVTTTNSFNYFRRVVVLGNR